MKTWAGLLLLIVLTATGCAPGTHIVAYEFDVDKNTWTKKECKTSPGYVGSMEMVCRVEILKSLPEGITPLPATESP